MFVLTEAPPMQKHKEWGHDFSMWRLFPSTFSFFQLG